MDAVERIKTLCKKNDIPISRLERDCGFSNGYIRGLREGKLPADRLYTVAEYLHVSPDYLLTGEIKESYYTNTETAQIAQKIFESRDLQALFDAAADCPPDVLRSAADLLSKLKRTNPDA